MICLSKNQTLRFIDTIAEDKKHQEKALFYKLQYYYARRSEEIALLQVKDIDFEFKEITFNIAKKKQDTTLTLKFIGDIEKDLHQFLDNREQKENDYLFMSELNKKDSIKRNMRAYLERNSNKIIKKLFNIEISLNTHDLRRLRGQHLYLAGAELEIIQKLYYHNDINQTIDYLQIRELEINKMLIDDMIINYGEE